MFEVRRVRPSDRPSDRPTVRPSDRPSDRPTVRPSGSQKDSNESAENDLWPPHVVKCVGFLPYLFVAEPVLIEPLS